MSLPKRRLWEFYGPLICRILGLAFDEKEQDKIAKKLKSNFRQPLPPASHMHGFLTNACARPNPVSKYVDKMLQERFELYRKRLDGLDQRDISRLIEERDGFRDVPLPALIWFASRHQCEEIDEIEVELFSTIHAMEHRALRLYDVLSRMLPNGKPENVVDELKETLRLNDELQKRYKRSEQKREQLKAEVKAIKGDKSSLALALTEERQLNERLRKDLERLGGESALGQIESLGKEKDLLAQEIESLTQELLKEQLDRAVSKSIDRSADSKVNIEDKTLASSIGGEQDINLPLALNGRRVAFVGGLQSLIPHYQQVVECLGGTFCFHSGKYTQGAGEIEKLVDKADVVFCPVDMNSHHACRYCKKICKLTGKPCCFLRSSGLGMFRRELVNYAKRPN